MTRKKMIEMMIGLPSPIFIGRIWDGNGGWDMAASFRKEDLDFTVDSFSLEQVVRNRNKIYISYREPFHEVPIDIEEPLYQLIEELI